MENQKYFEDICNELQLGALKGKIKKVSGGYIHKMYRVKTSNGDYAIKLLNPVIMQRPDVFENYRLAEELERLLQNEGIPIVPALEFYDKKMQCIQNQYLYVFDWVKGKPLKLKQIKENHCNIMGRILAQIHKIECKPKRIERRTLNINWDDYIFRANNICPSVVPLLARVRDILYKRQSAANESSGKVPDVTCVCNGDMDSKNVLWVNNMPKIIDLECLNYGNPYTELFQLALCWSGYESCNINYKLLKAFVKAYLQEYGSIALDWEVLYYSYTGSLEWLEYNVKRALMIECGDEEERKLGIEQVKETTEHIIYYDKIHKRLVAELENCLH